MTLPPLVDLGPGLDAAQLERYARHLALPGVGVDGQRRLARARVLVVGAGGLGSPALLYLAAAGVGTLGVVDDDVVDRSNLQRQVLHGDADVGQAKTASAARSVAAVAPGTRVVEHRERLSSSNAVDLLRGYDLVLDGSDNFATRYLVSDAAEIVGVPVVWGGLYRFTGQVSVFWAAPPSGQGVTYRDVFPEPPPPALAPDCATGGVLGSLCGVIGSTMATEAVKLITGTGRSLLGRLAVHDAAEGTWRHLDVGADPGRTPVAGLPDDDAYAAFCGLGPGGEAEITPAELAALPDPYVLDVREDWEITVAPFPGADVIASGRFLSGSAQSVRDAVSSASEAAAGGRVHVLCRSGMRSDRVAQVLRDAGLSAVSIRGGMQAWAGAGLAD